MCQTLVGSQFVQCVMQEAEEPKFLRGKKCWLMIILGHSVQPKNKYQFYICTFWSIGLSLADQKMHGYVNMLC